MERDMERNPERVSDDCVTTSLIDETDPRYSSISQRLRYFDRDILWIEEVINDALLSRYILAKEDLELTCGDNVEEMQLFHGTKMECLRKIMREGFKKSCNTRSTQGVGTYLAKDAETSLGYIVPDGGISFLFLCDVLVGRKCLHTKGAHEIEYFDCFVNSEKTPTVYVVPYDNAIYPRYVIALGKKRMGDAHTASYFTTFKVRTTEAIVKGEPVEKASRSGLSNKRMK